MSSSEEGLEVMGAVPSELLWHCMSMCVWLLCASSTWVACLYNNIYWFNGELALMMMAATSCSFAVRALNFHAGHEPWNRRMLTLFLFSRVRAAILGTLVRWVWDITTWRETQPTAPPSTWTSCGHLWASRPGSTTPRSLRDPPPSLTLCAL